MSRILVVGASGRTGRELIRQGVEKGHSMTAFVRDPGKAPTFPASVAKVKGDGLDARAVADAVKGHDAVLVAVGGRNSLVSAPVARNVIAGMKAAGVERVILVSAYGAGDSGHGFQGFLYRTALRKLNADKMEAERLLSESGLAWTAVRPAALGDGTGTGRYTAATDVVINGFKRLPRADLAAFMLDQLGSSQFVRKKPILAVA